MLVFRLILILFFIYFRIRELVKGDGPSHCKVYGDPTKLDSINLQDLHPSSWLVLEYIQSILYVSLNETEVRILNF